MKKWYCSVRLALKSICKSDAEKMENMNHWESDFWIFKTNEKAFYLSQNLREKLNKGHLIDALRID